MFTYKGLSLLFDKRVYEPAEDTFLLAEHLSSLDLTGKEALEIGIGTGIISLLLAKKCKAVIGVDINQHAINLAKRNADLNNITNVRFFESDLFDNVKGTFDLIVFNTPYVPTEGEKEDTAWDGGTSGRVVIDRFLQDVLKYLKPYGKIVMIESSLSDYKKTLEFFRKNGFGAQAVSSENIHFEEIVCIEAKRLFDTNRDIVSGSR